LEVGEIANIVLIDPMAERIIDPDTFASISRNSPYAAMSLPTVVTDLIRRGQFIVRGGELCA
jgi:dihydroorotase